MRKPITSNGVKTTSVRLTGEGVSVRKLRCPSCRRSTFIKTDDTYDKVVRCYYCTRVLEDNIRP